MSVSIVLVEPENSDNIGAVCRAMKNMGLSDLRLVKPPGDWREKGKKMAVSAVNVLESARVFSDLLEAVKEAHLVIGTTRRERTRQASFLRFDKAIQKIKNCGHKRKVAVLFGKESKGLSNAQVAVCDWFTTIPASSEAPSINLAQAVILVAFSLFTKGYRYEKGEELKFVARDETEEVLQRFRKALKSLGYKSAVSERINVTFHGMIKRSGLLPSEAQMIQGLSRRIRERVSATRRLGERQETGRRETGKRSEKQETRR